MADLHPPYQFGRRPQVAAAGGFTPPAIPGILKEAELMAHYLRPGKSVGFPRPYVVAVGGLEPPTQGL